MADVFISYSKQSPEPTRKLAADLDARGVSVWYDTELLPGEHFQQRLEDELLSAKTGLCYMDA